MTGRLRSRWLRRGLRAVALVGVVLAVLTTRVVLASRSELEKASQLQADGKLDEAVLHYRRAARWYAPGSPYPAEALASLAEIGEASAARGDSERALSAWRSVRAAILSTRSFYVPHQRQLARANARIAELMAAGERPPIDAGKSVAELRSEHLALLERDPRPRVLWSALALVGFGLWVGAAFAFASRAIDQEDRLVRGPALRWGMAIVVGLALFAVGLLLA